ncbi:DUF4097 family beta strand repeat-containing protein [Spirosoma aerolatum]|uniref:DUF4097 family beta strand repeat-containing protein n=1 Tax=Spirosoma aerolatum TaxID=1211326 RepID=UPI0009AEA69F|nr:DUF4097 family beta strand repeat-containing protein [Spirosoma aerolatum]
MNTGVFRLARLPALAVWSTRWFIWLIGCINLGVNGYAQSVQVITKIIDKELPYIENQPVLLTAQKADVMIKGWARPTISVRLRLIAKHPDRATAERELAYHQYALQSVNGQVDLSNRFVIPQSVGKLKSQLKAVYEISLPAKAFLTVTNSFGDINLTNLDGNTSLTFDFGKLTLDDIRGKLTIKSDYGDIDGRGLDAMLNVKAEKAEISLQDVSGNVTLQTSFGKLTLLPSPTLDALNVDATRTDILVATKRLTDFWFDVTSLGADIRVPENFADQLVKAKNKQTFRYQTSAKKPEIVIQNRYSPIVIQGEKTLVDRR